MMSRKRFKSIAEEPKADKFQSPPLQLYVALKYFAETVEAKFSVPFPGEPEDQIRAPLERLFAAYGRSICRNIVPIGQTLLKNRMGKPDFAVYEGPVIIGYVEAKAPGKGADPESFRGHDREQWLRFKNVPNIIYTDGNEWSLYRSGKLTGRRLRLKGDIRSDGPSAVSEGLAGDLFQIFAEFSSWRPIVPIKPKEMAGYLAPYCLLIREEVEDALLDEASPLRSLKSEIEKLLFPEATDRQFADAFAQTVIFALLLAQMEGGDVLDLAGAYRTLESHHLLLSRSLQFLTDPQAQTEIASSLSLSQRVIHEILPDSLKSESEEEDPWLYFYEHFLAKYDPKLRKAWGVYYTPVEVVRCQVRLIDEILKHEFGKDMGFVEPGVITLDPALGTGTYLLGIIDHALSRVEKEEGPGAIKGGARSLVQNLHGFEWMVGPYAVAQLRFTRALTAKGATLPPAGLGIYLTNTLESPHIRPPAPPLFHKPIAQEHERALKIKDAEHVLVCLGNPPYGRHEAAAESNRAVTGGWVRYGNKGERSILEDFLEPARNAGLGVHLKNLYNQYVYFIRWALWKVFEHKSAVGPGIVTFITASSYIEGDAFAGLREHMRRVCDRIDIIDLGGEGRGTRKDENIFAIQTPVAIFVTWRKARKADKDAPATVRYTRIEGSRREKIEQLDRIKSHKNLKWQACPTDWQAPFRPVAEGTFSRWPLISDIFPWQNNGVKAGRVWVIDPTEQGLRIKIDALMNAPVHRQPELFKNSPTGRKFGEASRQLPPSCSPLQSLNREKDFMAIPVMRYAYRSMDRQFIIADARFLDRPGPGLWQAHGKDQIYLACLLSHPLGFGPAIMACSEVADLHHFRGSYGGKDIIPLYRDSRAERPNILPGLLRLLSSTYKKTVSAEDLAGYVYAILAQPEYTSRFNDELEERKIRVPLTKSGPLFFKAAEFGKSLIWLHTYGERMTDNKRPKGSIPKGTAKCLKAVTDREENYPNEFRYDVDKMLLLVGEGRFGPVEPAVFNFEVSGFKVVKSWLGYRMREKSGKKSSPLDDIRPKIWPHEFTRELLELLWVLERTIGGYPEQKKLLDEVLRGDLFIAEELPPVPDESREAPKTTKPIAKDQHGINYPD